jgi:hypothetical protein
MIYVFIKNNEKYFRLKRCAKFSLVKGVIINGSQSVSDRNKELLGKEKITSIYFESKQRYGSPRMTVNASLGSKVSKLQWLNMNQLGLQVN